MQIPRVDLVLRGLETAAPVQRLRVNTSAAGPSLASLRSFVKALLVDPLAREAPWEASLDELLLSSSSRGGSLLLRYGLHFALLDDSSLPTIAVPSVFLQKRPLELLLTFQSADQSGGDHDPANQRWNLLTPYVLVSTSHTRLNAPKSLISYPVHRVIDIKASVFAYFSQPQEDSPREIISCIDSDEVTRLEDESSVSGKVITINSVKAAEAIDSLRWDKAIQYEDDWLASRFSNLISWMDTPLNKQVTAVAPFLIDTAQSILQEAQQLLDEALHQIPSSPAPSTEQPHSAALLRTEVRRWTTFAHHELAAGLDIAFATRQWHTLHRPWRTDDIAWLVRTILRSHWLVRSERKLLRLTGQILQAGYGRAPSSTAEQEKPAAVTPAIDDGDDEDPDIKALRQPVSDARPLRWGAPPPLRTISQLFPPSWLEARSFAATSSLPAEDPILLARNALLDRASVALQTAAQAQLAKAVLGAGAAVGLAVLLVGSGVLPLGAAGVVGALGVVGGLRRVQVKGAGEREAWEGRIREEGRGLVRELERRLVAALEGETRAERSWRERREEDLAANRRARDVVEGALGVVSEIVGGAGGKKG